MGSLGRISPRVAQGPAPRGEQREQLVDVVPERLQHDLALGVRRHLHRDSRNARPAGVNSPSATRPRSDNRASAAPSCSSDQARLRMYERSGRPQYNSVNSPTSVASRPADVQAAVWASPRYSRSRSANRHMSPTGSPGRPRLSSPAKRGRPSGRNGAAARASSSVARPSPSGSDPRTRTSWPTAPCVRAAHMVAASALVQPKATAGTTASGLKTAKAAATTSPGTCPSTEPRLVK